MLRRSYRQNDHTRFRMRNPHMPRQVQYRQRSFQCSAFESQGRSGLILWPVLQPGTDRDLRAGIRGSGAIRVRGKNGMISFRLFLGIVALSASFGVRPVLGQPATEPPSRIGNIWDGRAHEPDPSAVESDLKAKGYAVSPQRNRVVTDEVEDLYQQLIQGENGGGQQTASGGPAAARPGRAAPK
jgi:hypothetical protein